MDNRILTIEIYEIFFSRGGINLLQTYFWNVLRRLRILELEGITFSKLFNVGFFFEFYFHSTRVLNSPWIIFAQMSTCSVFGRDRSTSADLLNVIGSDFFHLKLNSPKNYIRIIINSWKVRTKRPWCHFSVAQKSAT